ncbi:hypothetical protein K525DRAFT_213688, partial [Schizophyllum commune Loenen D]
PDTCDDPICSCLSQPDLVAYALVCKDTHRAVKAYSSRAYRLRHMLLKFMDKGSVLAFRNMLRRTGTVISGSVALHYFARTPVGDSDLDLYTEGHLAGQVFAFIQSLGYAYSPRDSQDSDINDTLRRAVNLFAVRDDAIYNQRAVLDAFSFVRGEAVIQVMIVAESAIDTILDFHSTTVMNFITYRSAYSLYPYNTFIRMNGVRFIDDHGDGPIEKYKERGWRMSATITKAQRDKMGKEIVAPTRYVGDNRTWIIDLDMSAPLYPDPILFNSWHMHWTYRPGVWIMPEIRRLMYVGPLSWTQNRVFSDNHLLRDFVEKTTAQGADAYVHLFSVEDVLRTVLRSGQYRLFTRVPPSVSDTRFISNWMLGRPARDILVTSAEDLFTALDDGSVRTLPPPYTTIIR